ncbi:MAG: HEAT repeat domain-containing protein, partial [Gemmatimonadota bacterium]
EGESAEAVPPAVEDGAPPVSQAVSMENFVETTYFLDPDEAEHLFHEAEAEWRRDVRGAVLDALFDRVEDVEVRDRHAEILRMLGQLLPAFLGRGDLRNATKIVVEVGGLLEGTELSGEEREEAERLLRDLNEPQVLNQFLGSLEDGTIDPSIPDLERFLAYLGAEALPLLLRASERSESARLREKLAGALGELAGKHAKALVDLIGAPDDRVALAAALQAGRLQLHPAGGALVAMYRKGDVAARRRAIESLASISDADSLEAVQEALRDEDREVRVVAARGLGAMRNPASLAALRSAVKARALRDADLTEQIAFFEAFGAVALEEDITLLDRLLNGRRLLGKQSPETRACAAMALGAVATPMARQALLKAAEDQQPIVRNAVSKSLARMSRPS